MASISAAHSASASASAGASLNTDANTVEEGKPLSASTGAVPMNLSASAAMEEGGSVLKAGGNPKSNDHEALSSNRAPVSRNNSVQPQMPMTAVHEHESSDTNNPNASSSANGIPPSNTTTNNNSCSNTANNNTNRGEQTISYSAERIIGNGSFGVVFQAAVVETGEIVAIKKVLQDKRFKNRELQIMRLLVKDPHSNIVALKHCFYSQGEKPDELYLNLVLEFVAETVYSISRQHQKSKVSLPLLYVKLYLYQLSRALSHIHALGICHRDIKPQNLLVDPRTQQLKLCDFGSAKALVKGEPNVSYICSRYYRAPELIFGSTDYSTAIDVWSQGKINNFSFLELQLELKRKKFLNDKFINYFHRLCRR